MAAGRDNVFLPLSLKLESVLHLPKLTTKLISTHRLTRDLKSKKTIFNEFLCVSGPYFEGKIGAAIV